MIVVVGDDADLTDLLREFLEGEGYEVCPARDGAQAYALAREPRCKGMLLDWHMPGINAPELLLLFAAEGVQVPVLLMTSDPDFEESEMKQFANVRRLLHKPLVPEDLTEAVRAHLEKPAAAARA